jgi:hypothetical protein
MFYVRVVGPAFDHAPQMPYDRIIRELNLRSPRQAINLLASGKRIFERHARLQIKNYTARPDDIDREYADFCEILAKMS